MITEPLLNAGEGDYPAPVRRLGEVKAMFWKETVKLWRIGGLITFSMLCQFGLNTATTIFVGHLGNLQLSAVSISLTVIGSFSMGLMLGMGSALETLCGQAFGAGRVDMLGVYMQRSWIILSASCVIILPVYIFASPILKLLGQEDSVAELAGTFTLMTIPQLFSLAFTFPAQKFLQAQSKVLVLAWIGFLALVVHCLLLWLLVFGLDWGTTGAAVAYDVSCWVLTICQVVYATGWCKDGWKGLSWLAFKDLWAFFRLSLGSGVMICLELWYFSSIIILTGHLSNAVIAVGSLTICMTVNGIEVMVFLGINAAISVRVSNELGMGNARAAKYAVYVTVFQSLLIGLVCMVVVLVAKDYFAVIFTSNEDMQVAVSKLAFLLAITMVLNSVQPVLSGVAVGGGWQVLVAYINIGCYYVFGLPLGYVLGYVADLGVKGLWGGMIAGLALQTLLLIIIVYRTNWTKEVEQSAERMQKWGGKDAINDKDMVSDA